MRVLLTADSYLPYLSGVTVSVDALARGLGARGHEVLVLAPRPASGAALSSVASPGPAPKHAWLPSYELPRVVPAGYRMPMPNPAAGALAEARRFRPEVVHAHSPFVTGILGRRIARAVDAPLVFTHHTRFTDYAHYLGPLRGPAAFLARTYLRRFWLGCSAILAPSTDLADEIRDRLPARARGRVAVIPTGVDVEAIRAAAPQDPRSIARWAPDTVVIASLGRLAPEKSPETVLDAFALTVRRRRDLRLLFVGGGPLESKLRGRAETATLEGRVHVAGFQPRADALAMLRGSDIFAFASTTETQGLVLAEALAAGLPAVAVDGPGVRDSVRDGVDGIVVPATPREEVPRRLAEAMDRLAVDGALRAEMGRRARDDAERFAVDRRVAETESIYRGLVR